MLVPDITFVVVYVIHSEKLTILVLKRFYLVMFVLGIYILFDALNFGWCYRERSIAILPIRILISTIDRLDPFQ